MGRAGKINAAGDFLRAVGSRSARAQGAPDDSTVLPIAEILLVLASNAEPGVVGMGIDELGAEVGLSRVVLGQTLNNLNEMGLVEFVTEGASERAVLTEIGAVVAEKQSERLDSN
jgi:hypothetical protein